MIYKAQKKFLLTDMNNKGLGMIEVLIALFLSVIGILSIFSLVSPSWRTVSKSDYLGRASGILYEQLMSQESRLMNPCCNVTTGTLPATTINASGQTTSLSGDARFTVTTTITSLATNAWRVSVRVAWPGHSGISESLIVTRQEGFTFPSGCVVGGTTCQ